MPSLLRFAALACALSAALSAAAAAALNGTAACAARRALTAPGTTAFGFAVAASADLLVVSDFLYRGAEEKQTGAVVVYACAPAGTLRGCERTQVLTPPDGVELEKFGFFSALDGDLLVVGALNADGADVRQGAAYVYRCSREGACVLQTRITAADPQAYGTFGVSVAVDGERVVVGSNWRDGGGNVQNGAAYLFRCTRTTDPVICTQMVKLTPPTSSDYQFFGVSVSIGGNLLAVGSGTGAYVHSCQTETLPWSCTRRTTIQAYANVVAIYGATTVAVGSIGTTGRVLLYQCDAEGTSCALRTTLYDTDPALASSFGEAVALAGSSNSSLTVAVSSTMNAAKAGLADAAREEKGAGPGGYIAVYDCTTTGSTWPCTKRLAYQPEAHFADDSFGLGIALSADQATVVAGRPFGNDAYMVDCSAQPNCTVEGGRWWTEYVVEGTAATAVVERIAFNGDGSFEQTTFALPFQECARNTATWTGTYSLDTGGAILVRDFVGCTLTRAGCVLCSQPTTESASVTFLDDCKVMTLNVPNSPSRYYARLESLDTTPSRFL